MRKLSRRGVPMAARLCLDGLLAAVVSAEETEEYVRSAPSAWAFVEGDL